MYKPQLAKLVVAQSQCDEGETGFFTSASTVINRKLSSFSLSLTPSAVNDLYQGRRIGKNGVSLSTAHRLGALLCGTCDPQDTIYAFYGYVCDRAAQKAADQLAAIPGGLALQRTVSNLDMRIGGLEKVQAEILRLLKQKTPDPLYPLTAELIRRSGASEDEIKKAVEVLFVEYPEEAEETLAVFQGDLPPTADHWLNLAHVMGELTGDRWRPGQIAEIQAEVSRGKRQGAM